MIILKKIIMKEYDDNDIVKILNQRQAYSYMSNNVFPLFCEAGYNDRIVFVFCKSETEDLFNLWKEYKI